MRGGNFLQHAASLRARPRKAPVAERAVSYHGDTVLLTPGNHRVLNRTLFQMVEDLVADRATRAGDSPCLFKIGRVEVAHAPGEDLPLALELLEGRDGVQAGIGRASATGKNPAGRSSGERASSRKRLSFRGERHFGEGLWRPGRLHCAFRQSLRRPPLRRRLTHTARQCRYGSYLDRGPGVRRQLRRRYRRDRCTTSLDRSPQPHAWLNRTDDVPFYCPPCSKKNSRRCSFVSRFEPIGFLQLFPRLSDSLDFLGIHDMAVVVACAKI